VEQHTARFQVEKRTVRPAYGVARITSRAPIYILPMDRAYWEKQLREAEQELEAAKTRTEVNAAAKREGVAEGARERARKTGEAASRHVEGPGLGRMLPQSPTPGQPSQEALTRR
jgi:hypothetical protein